MFAKSMKYDGVLVRDWLETVNGERGAQILLASAHMATVAGFGRLLGTNNLSRAAIPLSVSPAMDNPPHSGLYCNNQKAFYHGNAYQLTP